MPFNEGQLKAIQQRNASILVSAPAGSGKTKILVSRIIELLKEGYSITEFLVLTFTEAAGNEMKQRLSEELNEIVSSDIDSSLKEHLEKQIQDLPHAYITNFHGFCNLLLMKYGYLVGVLPGFTINSDPLSIKKEVLQECLNKWILDNEIKEFFALYFPGYNFETFENVLLSIDELSHSIDDFYGFVETVHQQVFSTLSLSLEEWPLFSKLKNIFYNETILAMNKLIELKYYCETNHLTDFYERPDDQNEKNQLLMIPFESLYDYLDERINAFHKEITYDILVDLLNKKPEKSYNMNWKEIDVDIKKTFNKLKTDVLSSYNKAKTTYIEKTPEDFIEKMNTSYKAIDLLLSKDNLLDQFQQAYSIKKKELNQLDFSDLEKYTHILLEPKYGIVQRLYHDLKEIMVDEYQDTNQIQESLLLKISEYQKPHIPLFMVGDMKQSIYRFRQADPQIFLDKYNHFSLDDEKCLQTHTRRVDLVFNYRSHKIVLDSINYIFNAIMDKEIGGLEYYLDDSARLNYDYAGKENNKKEEARKRIFKDTHLKTEILIDIYDPNSSLSKEEYEAHMVAQKIIKLKEELKINDKPISFKDIVVLMRSTPAFLTFKKVFDLYHIPNHIVLSQGLMNSNEVETIMRTLKAINDPYDDISLLSVLTAPFSFSYINENNIAEVRIDNKDLSLYECLKLSENKDIIHFLEVFEELKDYSYTHSPYELVLKIEELSEYQLFVSQLINGQQRKANIDLLYEMIQQFQQETPYLKDIIATLENASDYAPASIASNNNDAVEFMTIHKSKGLEFPVVFVCNMHKKFNTQDSKERLIVDKHLGFALKPRIHINNEQFHDVIVEYENPYRNMIANVQLNESINEEMRILYVALTRASYKLILTGVIKDIDEIAQIQQKLLVNQSPDIYHREKRKIILYERLRKTNNYLSWILSAVLRHPDIIEQCLSIPKLDTRAKLLKSCHFEKTMTFDSTEHAMFSLALTNDQEIEENIPKRIHETKKVNDFLQQHYETYVYPYDLNRKETIAVTELQKLSDDHYLKLSEEEEQNLIAASDKGTLVHLLMSYLSFEDDDVDKLIEMLYQEELCDQTGKDILIEYKDHIQAFINSNYYQMISQASHIYKEKPFTYYDKQMDQIVHGIFDLVFIYQNQVYVLDYKTDRVSQKNSNTKLIQKHQVQLNYYQKVIKEMYKQDVKAIVYYLHIDKAVEF